MKIGFPEIRFILFGPMTPAFEALGHPRIREALIAVVAGRYPNAVPREAVEWGLLVHTESGWVPGPRLVCLPRLQPPQAAAICEGGRACAAVVSAALPRLKETLLSTIDGEPESLWHRYAFLTVAALLLDLQIGESLRRRGQVDKIAPGWRIWAVPHDPAVPAFGVRCTHDPGSSLGAGVCWHERLPAPPALPAPQDLYAFGRIASGQRAAPEALMRLRFGGWLEGQRLTAPLFSADAPLWAALEQTADLTVDDAYTPILNHVCPDRSAESQERLLLARMIMEQALEHLIVSAVVPAPGLDTARRWLWQGRSWCLADELVGG